MDDVRIGNTLRVVRIRKQLRQADVARRAGVSRETVSRLERGGFGRVPYDTFRAVATALGIRSDIRLRWRGGDLERVMNAAHADLHESIVRHLSTIPGWQWRPEVSFSIYGERGVIDILAWHAATRSLLIIELKTELVDPQELAATMGRRVRLGGRIAEQFGWSVDTVSAWVVFTETRTNHRRVLRHAGLLRAAFPADGHHMRTWLRRPTGRISALSYWTDVAQGTTRRTTGQPKRVRVRSVAVPAPDPSVASTPPHSHGPPRPQRDPRTRRLAAPLATYVLLAGPIRAIAVTAATSVQHRCERGHRSERGQDQAWARIARGTAQRTRS